MIDQAVNETFEFFNQTRFKEIFVKRGFTVPGVEEIKTLMAFDEDEFLYIQKNYESQRRINENELINNLKSKANEYISAKLSFSNELIFNSANSNNQGAILGLIKDHCYLSFWALFVGNELESFKFIESKTNQPESFLSNKFPQETPKTFDELFYNTDLVTPCIDILKELDPPFIDTDCNYIGKLKGVFCVWIDEMQKQGIVKHYSDRKIFASLIPQKIKRFSIDESMFGKHQSRAETLYRTDIKTKVSKIKLSQNSH